MTSLAARPVSVRELTAADALQRRAVQQNVRGHAAQGEQLARRGLQILAVPDQHDPADCEPARCRTTTRLLATLAKSTVEIRGVEAALAVVDRSISWSGCLTDPALAGFLISQRALILFRGGRLDEAEAAFAEAEAHLPEGGIDVLRLLLNRSALRIERGDCPPARTDLRRAVRLSRELSDRHAERIALHNLGCLEFTAGDLPLALRLMHEGMEMDGDTQQGIAHLDRSRVLLAAGLTDEADAALARAAELFRRDRCWQDLGEVDLTRAEVALMTGRYAAARQLAGQARNRFRRHGNERWRRAAELLLLHADQRAGRPPRRLLAPAGRLAEELDAAGFRLQARTALLLTAEIEHDLGEDEEVDALLSKAGPAGARDPIALRLHTRLVMAGSLERRGQPREARRVIARGLTELATYQAQFGGIDLQSASAVHGGRLAARGLALAVRTGRPSAVLAAVERSRAVTGRIRPVTPPADEQTAALLTELRRAMQGTESATAGLRGVLDRPPEIEQLQAELQARAWLNHGSRAWRPPASLAELREAAASDDCDLVTLTELDGQLGAVTVTADGRASTDCLGDSAPVRSWLRRMSADLDVLANAGLPAALAAAATRSLQHGAVEVGHALEVALPDDGRRVVVSPPSWLLALPWTLLPQLSGRPVDVTPSLSGWHHGRENLRSVRRQLAPDAAGVAVVAGPGLPRAVEEAAAVARTWHSRTTVQHLPAASPGELLTVMDTVRVAHIAAHGVHEGENPMFSSLSMTGGPLFAYELDQRSAVPEHVVLSACELGRSTVRAGEETLGLTSVLLQLGTPSVVAGVARVHDDVAAEIMVRYHRELAAGRDAAEALCLVADQVATPSPFLSFGTAWSAPPLLPR